MGSAQSSAKTDDVNTFKITLLVAENPSTSHRTMVFTTGSHGLYGLPSHGVVRLYSGRDGDATFGDVVHAMEQWLAQGCVDARRKLKMSTLQDAGTASLQLPVRVIIKDWMIVKEKTEDIFAAKFTSAQLQQPVQFYMSAGEKFNILVQVVETDTWEPPTNLISRMASQGALAVEELSSPRIQHHGGHKPHPVVGMWTSITAPFAAIGGAIVDGTTKVGTAMKRPFR